jgi:MoxR-like ATPase
MKTFESYLKGVKTANSITYQTGSVSFENKNRKRFVLLPDDLHTCLRALYKSGDQINREFNGDWNYEETKYRQAFGQIFDPLQPNSVSTSLGSQTPSTVRILELYAGYLLGVDAPEELSTPDLLKPESLALIFKTKKLREHFEYWLKQQKSLSDKSISHYSGTIANKLSRVAGCDLYEVQTIEELEKLRSNINQNQEYKDANSSGKDMYGAALNNYEEFLSTYEIKEAESAEITTINSRLWIFSPGEGAYLWDDQYKNGEAAIGWDALGDLSQYETRTGISNKLKELENLERTPWNNSLACWQFLNEIQLGDWILVKKGKGFLLGYGVVTSDYIYDPAREQYHHVRKVDWQLKGEWDAKEFSLITKTLTDLTPHPDYVAKILTKMGVEIPGFITDRMNIEGIETINVTTSPSTPRKVLSSYKKCVLDSGFNFKEALLDGFLAALISKPFTILTGASGTGKTKIAELLAKHLSDEAASSYATVPVGADWTDNRNVLGFVNHLRDDGMGEGQAIFQSTKVLDLLLNADKNPDYPHFLILDEMNLSHVERYFSDFLSVMEQKDGELKLHSEGDLRLLRSQDDKIGVPQALAYPKNLFVIGTVNIDETTYMFSPKVLDRANVIEFTVSAEDIGVFLAEPKAYQDIERAEEGIAEGFLDLARKAREADWGTLEEPASKDIAAHLLNLFKILKAGRFEFAYRTAKEVNTYLRVCRHLSTNSAAWDAGSWSEDLDDQILQKLLPKLHGSVGRVGGLLAALAKYCHSGEYLEPEADSGSSQQNQNRNQLTEAATLELDSAQFPRSLEKLQSMIQTLRDEQFVSFIQ